MNLKRLKSGPRPIVATLYLDSDIDLRSLRKELPGLILLAEYSDGPGKSADQIGVVTGGDARSLGDDLARDRVEQRKRKGATR